MARDPMSPREAETAAYNQEQARRNAAAPKGPRDRLTELDSTSRRLTKHISEGRSGDGLTGENLEARLRAVNGERALLRQVNPGMRGIPLGMPAPSKTKMKAKK